MADFSVDIVIDDTAAVVVADPTAIDVSSYDQPMTVVAAPGEPGPRGAIGPQGPQGDPGPAFEGTAFWYGEGIPTTIIGSKPGDYYLDTTTGTFYKLG